MTEDIREISYSTPPPPSPVDTRPRRVQLLHQSANLIDDQGQRSKDYGTPEENFTRIAKYWNILFAKNLKENREITPAQVSEAMALLKIARIGTSPTEDSFLDAQAYIAIAGELTELEPRGEK